MRTYTVRSLLASTSSSLEAYYWFPVCLYRDSLSKCMYRYVLVLHTMVVYHIYHSSPSLLILESIPSQYRKLILFFVVTKQSTVWVIIIYVISYLLWVIQDMFSFGVGRCWELNPVPCAYWAGILKIFKYLFFETGSYYINQAGLEPLGSTDVLASAF